MKVNQDYDGEGWTTEVKKPEAWQVPPIVLAMLNANRQAKALQHAILDTYTCKNCGFALDVDLQSGKVPCGYRWCPVKWHESSDHAKNGWVRTQTLSCQFFFYDPEGRIGR